MFGEKVATNLQSIAANAQAVQAYASGNLLSALDLRPYDLANVGWTRDPQRASFGAL